MGFPVCAEAGEKSKKQDITAAKSGSSVRSEVKEVQSVGKGKKKPHPACERAFCSSVMRVRRGLGFLSLVDAKSFALRIAAP